MGRRDASRHTAAYGGESITGTMDHELGDCRPVWRPVGKQKAGGHRSFDRGVSLGFAQIERGGELVVCQGPRNRQLQGDNQVLGFELHSQHHMFAVRESRTAFERNCSRDCFCRFSGPMRAFGRVSAG